jgi:putative sterol carrier protein
LDFSLTLEAKLEKKAQLLAPHFKPAFLQRDHAVFQFCFDEGESFYLEVDRDEFHFSPGYHNSPTLTLYIDAWSTCWNLLIGKDDGMQAFMEGRYRADGNIVLSQLLLYLFKSDDPTIAYRLVD